MGCDDVCFAAESGDLELLKWAREHGCPLVEVDEDVGEYTMNSCACAAWGGRLEVVKWLREQDCPWNVKNGARRPLRADTWRC